MPKVHRAFRPRDYYGYVRLPGSDGTPPIYKVDIPGWYRTALELIQDKEIREQLLGHYTEKEAIKGNWL